MSERIVIDPVTRIEGHAKITIQLDDAGEVTGARFHVTEFRGFERFCEGRSFREMPMITSRICGICPVSHLLASAKATDALLAVEIPETARALRRLVNLAQLVQSHALSFFHLSSPDLLLGADAAPERRNLFALAAERPEIARDGIRLRRFGQDAIEAITGRRIHPTWAVPGGVARPLAPAARERILAGLPEALEIARRTLDGWKRDLERHQEEARVLGNFPTLFMGMVAEDGTLEHTDGKLRVVDETGAIVADQLDPQQYERWIGEAVEPDSYLKAPYFRPRGEADGTYRVGPLARLNVASRCGTPLADAELAEFRQLGRGAVLSSFHAHYARLVEIVHALERMRTLLDAPEILGEDVAAIAMRNRLRGVGACEAPRGTLFHDYEVVPGGLLTRVNLLVATGQNARAMNRAVAQIARHYLSGRKLDEGLLNRVEAGIRAFDPCLSCSTHAAGRMPLSVELLGPDGAALDAVERS
ncbi:Ni/Fe hydrogenase subunit alpha [Anaeromyxobacter oryzae]|uniref:NADP oxidoreductase n=1 Tax=Anaeromyxobacter oryzae TaxID=2918170 RepID=A0ABN6MXV1_9BACT|nr:Ni/Fe hydrogenase subunit alpha [Anaeromyxobacter oryzae]BDG05768.1 NADP oxidoreductase [Anaeromyxobacter oryzae]